MKSQITGKEQETSFDLIMAEDFKNLEPMQVSHDSGVFESMPLNYQEKKNILLSSSYR